MNAGKYLNYDDEEIFVNDPKVVSEYPWNWLTALWYWHIAVRENSWSTCKQSWELCKDAMPKGHFDVTISAINPIEMNSTATKEQIGQRQRRFENYQRLYKAFRLPGEPKH